MNLFVIIVTFKGHQWYERCFTSLRKSEIPVQIVVVDNASNDGTVEYIRENFPEMHLIESKENLGFGRANNIGIQYAIEHGCDYVFLLNQDAWIEPNTLKELVRIHTENSEYGVLSPLHLTADRLHIERGILSYLTNNKFTDSRLLEDLYFDSIKDVYESKYINAAGWLIPRETLNIIGGFCPIIYHYGEDDDYMNRLIYHKIKLGLCPNTTMVHDKSVSLINSDELSKRAILYCVDDYLNINVEINFFKVKIVLIKNMIKSFLKKDKLHLNQFIKQYKYLRDNTERLINIREQHKYKQPNWL